MQYLGYNSIYRQKVNYWCPKTGVEAQEKWGMTADGYSLFILCKENVPKSIMMIVKQLYQ